MVEEGSTLERRKNWCAERASNPRAGQLNALSSIHLKFSRECAWSDYLLLLKQSLQ
jgi:hypothetical protein